MMSNQQWLYYLILVLSSTVVITALGGGIFNQSTAWYFQWQHQAFSELCHQIPERSLWISNQPMAVCSRCLGIYCSFLLGWMLLPAASKWGLKANISLKKMILYAVILNFIDIGGNLLGFWQNTLVSRLLLGSLIGGTVAFLFLGSFFNRTINITEHHHGRITTADV